MSSFTSDLLVSPLPDGKRWKLVKEFSYYLDEEGGETIIVPSGFITDFASVPRIFLLILPSTGRYSTASVIHDLLYTTRERSRKESDEIFYNGMIILGTKKWKAWIMYKSVRLFGWLNYYENSWTGLFSEIFHN
jgi:hypothetical protein